MNKFSPESSIIQFVFENLNASLTKKKERNYHTSKNLKKTFIATSLGLIIDLFYDLTDYDTIFINDG